MSAPPRRTVESAGLVIAERFARALGLLAFFMTPAVAFAQDVVPPSSSWQGTLLALVFSVLGMVLSGGVALIFASLRKKMGLDITEKQQALVQDVVAQAVAYAEEQARKRVLHEGGAVPTGNEKMQMAVDLATNKMADMKLPAIDAENIKPLIEARLQDGRDSLGKSSKENP